MYKTNIFLHQVVQLHCLPLCPVDMISFRFCWTLQTLRLYKYLLDGCWSFVIFGISEIQSLLTSCMKACY